MRDAGVEAPVVGDLADKGADALLDGVAHFPEPAARAETEQWLARREPAEAARELLVAAKGSDPGAPLRRLHCQQSLALVGGEAEPAVRGSWTTRSWAGSPACGSPSWGPPMCRRRPSR